MHIVSVQDLIESELIVLQEKILLSSLFSVSSHLSGKYSEALFDFSLSSLQRIILSLMSVWSQNIDS